MSVPIAISGEHVHAADRSVPRASSCHGSKPGRLIVISVYRARTRYT